MKLIKFIFLFVFGILIFHSCKKDPDQLTIIAFSNPADSISPIQIITIDSFKSRQLPVTQIDFYFHINYNLIADTSQIQNIHVEGGSNGEWNMPKKQRTWFSDINVYTGDSFYYRFALRTKSGFLSKYTPWYNVTVK